MGAEAFAQIGSEATTIEAPFTFQGPEKYSNSVLHEIDSSDQLADGVSKVDHAIAVNKSLAVEELKDKQDACKPEAIDSCVLEVSNGKEANIQIGAVPEEKGSGWDCIPQEADGSGWISADGTPVILPAAATSVSEQPWPSSRRRTHYMIRVPRIIDNKLRNEIKLADMHLEAANKKRDFLRAALQIKKASKAELLEKLRPIREKDRGFKDAMQSKRTALEPFSQALTKFKNAHSTAQGRGQDLCSSEEELNDKIAELQYRIQHESIPLKEEKLLVREIKLLEATRNQVSAKSVLQLELVENLGPKEDIQDQYKLICQELDVMRKELKQTRTEYEAIDKEIEKLNAEIEDIRQQFEKANFAQQEAYEKFRELRKQENSKNDMFYQNKRDIQAAKELISQRKLEALENFCLKQVEDFFAMWNTDSKFRAEYVKSNERSTLKRLDTLDGRSLGPDEEPPLVLLENDANTGTLLKSDNRPVAALQATASGGRTKASKVPNGEIKMPETVVEVIKNEKSNEIHLSLESAKSEEHVVARAATASLKPSQNSLEDRLENAARAAELKERRRQEEMTKAKEAAERKKRRAERAESKALERAKKDAERKEKEREKRERKKAAANTSQDESSSSGLQSVTETGEATSPVPNDIYPNAVKEIYKPAKGLPGHLRKPLGKTHKPPRAVVLRPFSKKATWPIPMWALVLLAVLAVLVLLIVFISL